jgi:hypothetical protein
MYDTPHVGFGFAVLFAFCELLNADSEIFLVQNIYDSIRGCAARSRAVFDHCISPHNVYRNVFDALYILQSGADKFLFS